MPGRRRKYKNVKEVVDGITFDSRKEAARYRELKLLHQAGEITEPELQPKYPLVIFQPDGTYRDVRIRSVGYPKGRAASYTADFRYQDKRNGEQIVEDVKGMDTTASRLRRAVVEAIYAIEIQLI
jgi:hypothetical protein